MAKVGDAYIEVKPDLDNFGAALRAQMAGKGQKGADDAGRKTGLRFGNAMTSGIAASLGRATGLASLVATMAGPLASVASGVTAGLTAMASSIAAASGSAAAALPLFTALAQGMTVTKIGTFGMAKAFKLTYKAAQTMAQGGKITAKQQKELAASLENLAPAARQTIVTLVAMKKEFDTLRLPVQQALFKGVAATLRSTATVVLPTLIKHLTITASTLNTMAKQFVRANTSASAMGQWNLILASNNSILVALGAAATSVFGGLRASLVALMPYGRELAATIADIAARFNIWANSAAGQDAIAAFMDQAFKSASLLLGIVKNLAVALGNIFKAGTTSGDSLLAMLVDLTGKFATWTGSLEGQSKLASWFDEGKQVMVEVAGLIGDIAKAFGTLAGSTDASDMVAQLRTSIAPILDLITQLNATGVGQQLIASIGQIAQALADMNAGGGISAFLSTLTLMVTTVSDLVQVIPGGTTAVAGFATAMGTLAAIKFASSVTGIDGLVKAMFGLTKMGGGKGLGRGGAMDEIRLQAMALGDSARSIGGKISSGFSTAWTGIQIGALNAKSALSGIASSVASTGSKLGTALASGAARAGGALKSLAVASAEGVAALARMIAMNVRTAASMAITTARTVAAAVVQRSIRVATVAWAAAQAVLNAIMALNPFVLIIGALILLGVALVIAYKKSETFRNIVNGVFNTIKTIVVGALNVIRAIIVAVWNFAVSYITGTMNTIRSIVTAVWNAIRSVVLGALHGIQAIISVVFSWARGYIRGAMAAIRAAVAIFGAIAGQVRGWLSGIRNAISSGFSAARSAVSNAMSSIRSAISSGFNSAKAAVSNAMHAAVGAIRSAFSSMVGAVKAGIGAVRSALSGIKGAVTGAVSGAAGWLASAGSDMISGLIGGIRNMAGSVASAAKDVVQGAVNAAKSALKIGSPSKVFMDIGVDTGAGLAVGISSTEEQVQAATDSIIPTAKAMIGLAGAGLAALPKGLGQTQQLQVRVFIGEQELTDIVRVVVGNQSDQLADRVVRGRREIV